MPNSLPHSSFARPGHTYSCCRSGHRLHTALGRTPEEICLRECSWPPNRSGSGSGRRVRLPRAGTGISVPSRLKPDTQLPFASCSTWPSPGPGSTVLTAEKTRIFGRNPKKSYQDMKCAAIDVSRLRRTPGSAPAPTQRPTSRPEPPSPLPGPLQMERSAPQALPRLGIADRKPFHTESPRMPTHPSHPPCIRSQ